MSEREKYIHIYSDQTAEDHPPEVIPGKMGGGYGRICWGENMLKPLKKWKASSLLDVGCGYGNFCDAAALFVPRVYGLDIASVATGKVINNPDITYFDGEAKSLPLPAGAVEWITSFDCLEHCLEEDIDDILDEFDRVASKGFVLSISYESCEMEGMPLHMTVRPESWWMNKLKKYGHVTKEGHAPITGIPYLICRKPMVPRGICYCAGGIGKRLRSIAWAAQWCQLTGRQLAIRWLANDPQCRIEFSALFNHSIPLITEKELLELHSCKIYADIKAVADQALINGGQALRKVVQKWGINDLDALSTIDDEDSIVIYHQDCAVPKGEASLLLVIEKLRLADPIRHQTRELALDLHIDKQMIGVHARGTDFGIDVDAYAHQMEKAIQKNPKVKFWVCSDEKRYVEKLQERFHDHVVTRHRSAWIQKKDPNKAWFSDNIETSAQSIGEDLIDLNLLALTDFQIYHESSAYAQVGQKMSKARMNMGLGLDATSPAIEKVEIQPLDHQSRPHQSSEANRKSINRSDRSLMETTHPYRHSTILYFCPDIETSSAGIRRLYRHVEILDRAGFSASIVHEKKGFKPPDMPLVPVSYMDQIEQDENLIFVIPEGMPRIMNALKHHPGRRFVIALNWHYIFSTLPDNIDWRHMNVERVMVVSPTIGQLISWSMGLPTHLLQSSIDHRYDNHAPNAKQPQICFIERKATNMEKLKRLLCAKNKIYINNIKWVGLDSVSQDLYAAQICKSSIFLNTSMAEGFPTSCMEAMAAGTIVAGYDAVGGRDLLKGEGPQRNCLLAPNGDYPTLAYALAPLLDDLIEGRMNKWNDLIANAHRTASQLTVENETTSLIEFWRQCLGVEITGTCHPIDHLDKRCRGELHQDHPDIINPNERIHLQ